MRVESVKKRLSLWVEILLLRDTCGLKLQGAFCKAVFFFFECFESLLGLKS